MEPEDEAFEDLERKLHLEQQKKVATGVTDGTLWRKRQINNLECPHCGWPIWKENDPAKIP